MTIIGGVDLQSLRTFVAVAEELHFGRAADRLHLAQQAVSQQIKRLERDLGTELFHRTTRQVELTKAGSALQADARRLLTEVSDTRRRVTAVASGRTGTCRVGYDPNTVTTVLPRAIQRCQHDLPGIALQLEELCPPELERRVLAGGVDLGLTGPVVDLDGLESTVLAVDHPVLVVRDAHHLSGAQQVHLADLGAEPFITYDHEVKPGAHELVRQLHSVAGIEPPIAQTASSELAVLGLVAAGCGVGIVAGHTAATTALPIRALPIDPTLALPNHLIWAPDRRDGPTAQVIAVITASATS